MQTKPLIKSLEVLSSSDIETQNLGKELGKKLKKGLICLYGDLGSGKTTFTKGLAKGLGIKDRVQSPTFVYERVYKGRKSLYHFDCYRVTGSDPLLASEVQDILEKNLGVVVIEWARHIEDFLPTTNRINIFFEEVGDDARRLTFHYYE